MNATREEGQEPTGRAYQRLSGADDLSDVMLPQLRRRQDYFDYLEGHSVEAFEGLHQQRSRTLLKSYVLETRGGGVTHEETVRMFGRAGHTVTTEGEDDTLILSAGAADRRWGLLERVDERYLALYTLVRSADSDPVVRELVRSTSGLDRLWLSPTFFDELWRSTVSPGSSQRFARMSFAYDALYESPRSEEEPEDEESLSPRSARMRFADTVATIDATLPKLRKVYQPLHSIVHLRLPGQAAGGHDIFNNGKLTNRTASFAEHRSLLRDVARRYDALTRRAEQTLWPAPTEGGTGLAAPFLIEFSAPLTQATFERWVTETFSPRTERLRLWGKPIRLGPSKAHVYAIDEHLWQPIQLEMTRHHLLALLPYGTCGNSVNRLVTNLQQTLDPGLRAWLAGREYSTMLEASAGG